MRTARTRGRLTTFQAGLIALVVIVIATFFAFTKDIPFTTPYQLKARFENAPPIQRGQAVRIAGVDVGKVAAVEPVGGDSPAVTVIMKLEESALPIHEDAEIKVRPRIFFEGNLFFDLKPGTPGRQGAGRRRDDPRVADLGARADRSGARPAEHRHARGPARAAGGLRRRAQRRAPAR